MKYSVNQSTTLKEFIAVRLPQVSKTKIKEMVDRRNVFVNNKRVWILSYQLRRGDVVELPAQVQTRPTKVEIVYSDEYLLIINKPFGINSNGEHSLERALRKQLGDNAIEAVHRLDKDTSGLLIFARNHEVFERMKEIFFHKKIKKEYVAVSQGGFTKKSFSISSPIDGQPALSHFRVIQQSDLAALLVVDIETGRKHQIRKHLASIGHPVAGENLYNTGVINNQLLRSVPRQMLHAWKLEFIHPYTQAKIQVAQKLPEDMDKILRQIFQNYDLI